MKNKFSLLFRFVFLFGFIDLSLPSPSDSLKIFLDECDALEGQKKELEKLIRNFRGELSGLQREVRSMSGEIHSLVVTLFEARIAQQQQQQQQRQQQRRFMTHSNPHNESRRVDFSNLAFSLDDNAQSGSEGLFQQQSQHHQLQQQQQPPQPPQQQHPQHQQQPHQQQHQQYHQHHHFHDPTVARDRHNAQQHYLYGNGGSVSSGNFDYDSVDLAGSGGSNGFQIEDKFGLFSLGNIIPHLGLMKEILIAIVECCKIIHQSPHSAVCDFCPHCSDIGVREKKYFFHSSPTDQNRGSLPDWGYRRP